MRNLELLKCLPVTEVDGGTVDSFCLTIDCDTGTVYTATATDIVGIQPSTQQIESHVSMVTEGFLPEGGSAVVGIQHLPDLESVCVCTIDGEVLLYGTITQQIECVGSTDSGITCMSWSPDQELVVFTTGENTIIMMTKDFDPITEFPIHTTEFGEEKPMNVGWGKKETQFHGSAGKPTMETLKPVVVNPVSAWDDKHCRISWRGDGQFFVVSSLDPDTGARRLRTWSREGVLMSSSEEVDGLEEALSWKPSGSLIASTQRRPHRHEIVFFERNGLRHGEFTLPFQRLEVKVVELAWNSDSTVLAIWIEELPPPEQQNFTPKSYIQLWAVNNYNWYLKQELVFQATPADRVACFTWDPEVPLKLHTMVRGGQYTSYEWTWSTTYSRGHSPNNMSAVAVIDGARLLLTPMKHMIVPPPMAAQTIAMSTAIQAVTFAPPPACNDMAVLLSSGDIAILRGSTKTEQRNGFVPPGETPHLQGVYSIDFGDFSNLWRGPGSLHHVTWWRENMLVGVAWDVMLQTDVLCQIDVVTQTDGQAGLRICHVTEVDEPVMRVFSNPDTGSLAVQLASSIIMKYISDVEDVRLSPWLNYRGEPVVLPQPCVQIMTALVGQEEVILGLTEHYRLYVNDKEVASNCTSFAVHDEFLLLTTHAHTCRCISLLPSSKGLPVLTEDQPHALDENVRRVERGSRLVVAVTDDTKVILQMPRGNLETIHPRALVVSYLQKCLNSLQYKEAFLSMRRHRINLNLIYDHSPQLFLDNVETFLRQVETVSFINLFLSDLKEEDMTTTMYADFYTSLKKSASDDITKVDRICEACRTALQKIGPEKYLLPILTSYVRKTEPQLETVLNIINHIKNTPSTSSSGSVTSDSVTSESVTPESVTSKFVTSEEALKYVLFLVDVNQMYDVALGMYDFKLVLMIAEKSQKDPKEYLPFLNSLRKMETNFQRYTIDKYLKRYSKALEHLSKCGPDHFDDLLVLMKEKTLYKQALNLYAKPSDQNKTIAVCYGEHLSENKRHEEAGIVFSRCGAHEQALQAFQRCGNWRHAFCMASRLAYTDEKKIQLARSLADYLKGHGRFTEAAVVLEDYGKDPEESIVALIDGGIWDEALRMIYKYNRLDIIETNLKVALKEGYTHHCSTITQHNENFIKYKARLHVVRETKERVRLEILESGTMRDDTDADIFSDTSSITGRSGYGSSVGSGHGSSVGSRGTRSTGRSSKTRRKSERKKFSLKKGSPYEDIALMHELCDIITRIDKSKEDISSLLRSLCLFEYDSEAAELQSEFDELITLTESSTPEIWPPEHTTVTEQTVSQVTGPGATVNSILAAMNQGPQATQSARTDVPEMPKMPTTRKDSRWKLDQLEK